MPIIVGYKYLFGYGRGVKIERLKMEGGDDKEDIDNDEESERLL